MKELKKIVTTSWDSIFKTVMGNGYKIGVDIFPKPQIMAFFLHELIALEIIDKYPKKWTGDETGFDKDLVCVDDGHFSIEIKASSNPKRIFGNRSYAQQSSSSSKKGKSGYYLAINFEKFTDDKEQPKLLKIRFGWLDHSDWRGQKAASGQAATLSPEIYDYKLLEI